MTRELKNYYSSVNGLLEELLKRSGWEDVLFMKYENKKLKDCTKEEATEFLAGDGADDGEQITGLSTNWDRLVVFTEHNAYMYDQSIWKQAFAYGCSAHRTIQNHGAYMIWANYDGVWMFLKLV